MAKFMSEPELLAHLINELKAGELDGLDEDSEETQAIMECLDSIETLPALLEHLKAEEWDIESVVNFLLEAHLAYGLTPESQRGIDDVGWRNWST